MRASNKSWAICGIVLFQAGVALAQQDLSCPSTNSCSVNENMLVVNNTNTGSSSGAAFFSSNNSCNATLQVSNFATASCGGYTGGRGIYANTQGPSIFAESQVSYALRAWAYGTAETILASNSSSGDVVRANATNGYGVRGSSTN